MENQSYQLIKGLSDHFVVHTLVYDGQQGEGKVTWFRKVKKRVKALLAKHPDIALIHLNDGLMGAACRWMIDEIDVPVVVTYHGLDVTFPLQRYQKQILGQMRGFAGGIAVSEATREQCIKRGFDQSKVVTVPNGVDHDLADMPHNPAVFQELEKELGLPLKGKRIIVTMGRAVKRKGFSWFINTVLPQLNDDVYLLIIGPFKKEADLQEKLIHSLPKSWRHNLQLLFGMPSDEPAVREALKTSKNVAHIGPQPFKRLMEIVGAAELFVMPNQSVDGDAEGFGLVALEASLRGTPVIAAGIEGITEAIIDGGNGILLDSLQTDQWVDTIGDLLNNPEKLNQLSSQTVEYTKQHYSWEKMVEGYAKYFKTFM